MNMYAPTSMAHAPSEICSTATDLDDPIAAALTMRQAHLAVAGSGFLAFPPDVSPFAAFGQGASLDVRPNPRADRILAAMSVHPAPMPAGYSEVDRFAVVQMVAEGKVGPRQALRVPGLQRLGAKDAPEMVALAQKTQPGPFERNTRVLGP
ncbi:MAG: hypothetical protein AAF679_11615, partial [Pseudomonadota bacterium]